MAWYAAYTQALKESLAARHLENQDFSVYLPLYRKSRRHARRIEVIGAPLFPRYVFVTIDVEGQRWRSVNGTVGVCGLVMSGGHPLPVPNAVIEEIRRREDSDGMVALNPQPFTKGQPLRVKYGPMDDVQGLFDSLADQKRVFMLMHLLGREVRVRVPLNCVTAA